jgi:hypothetical protein
MKVELHDEHVKEWEEFKVTGETRFDRRQRRHDRANAGRRGQRRRHADRGCR